ncbi:MAG: hypothetical protein OEY01_14360 [Desulfobulbaceae bacterium]|nr:hypothetical protein [Desulfobulbaceae bacterium]
MGATNYALGKTSIKRLDTCHPAWWAILHKAIKTSPIDFGVVCGARGEDDQNKALAAGKSNALWGESDHNWMLGNNPCSLAVDVAPYSAEHRNYMWPEVVGQSASDEAFKLMSDHIIATAAILGYVVESGANYSAIKGGDKPHHVLKFRSKS